MASVNQVRQLLDFFDVKTTLSYVRAKQPQDYIGPTLFPVKNVNTLDIEYFKSQNKLPVMATLQTFGAETPIASREGFQKVEGSIPAIKRKINLDERYLIALRREGIGDMDTVRNEVFNDLDRMTASVHARVEGLCIEALSTGKLTLAENGVVLNVDYGVDSTHKDTLESTALWSAGATATPVDDIATWTEKIVDDSGIRPTRALTSNTVVAALLKSQQIREMIHGESGSTIMITLAQVNTLLAQMELPQIAQYNQKYRIEAAAGTYTTARFLDDSLFLLLPPDPLGETLYGPTAEALMSDAGLSATEISGLYSTVTSDDDPPAIWTKVAATAIPTFSMADAVFIATVLS